ncbi:hypothetical protein F4778DRAFT_734218 [Xylariomycetidae sp. FL2044]|nr:hypothetical protein F4778DRAFT_734218 [Xylariomycetidae sp. FL2044]
MPTFLQFLQRIVTSAFHFLTANLLLRRQQLVDPSLASATMKHIVIVGGSFTGVSTAHRILKQAAKTATGPFKITLVSRDSHFYWSIAAPRAMIPGQFSDEELFLPIAPGFAQYPAGQVEFVLGSATGLDTERKQLIVADASDADGSKEKKVDYDILIIGTGSSTQGDSPLKSRGSTESTKAALHEWQDRVAKAKSIVVVGAGPTGVEIAGELGYEYGKSKEITLISSGPTVLEGRPASVSRTAESQLRAVGVHIKLNTKVGPTSQQLLPDGRHELVPLSAGGGEKKIVVDLVIPTFGVKPNSAFIPSGFLDAAGFVKVDDYLRVVQGAAGAGAGAEGVFAIGDVNNVEPPQFMFAEKQSTYMAKNVVLMLSEKLPVPYQVATKNMMGLQIGKKQGTGHYGNMKLPSFLVSMLRKTLFIERAPTVVDGSKF